MSTPFRLQIPRSLYDEMIAQAFAELPNECCGLFAGCIDGLPQPNQEQPDEASETVPVVQAVRRYGLVNAAASPREFLSDARSLFLAARDMRDRGIDIICVYHSHPNSKPKPSPKDLRRNMYPRAVCMIISLRGNQPEVRAWWLSRRTFKPAEFDVV